MPRCGSEFGSRSPLFKYGVTKEFTLQNETKQFYINRSWASRVHSIHLDTFGGAQLTGNILQVLHPRCGRITSIPWRSKPPHAPKTWAVQLDDLGRGSHGGVSDNFRIRAHAEGPCPCWCWLSIALRGSAKQRPPGTPTPDWCMLFAAAAEAVILWLCRQEEGIEAAIS